MGAWLGNAANSNEGRTARRGALGFLSMGTSEIKTGSGEHGDETLADALFPKNVNNFLDPDREDNRARLEAEREAELERQKPKPGPDETDKAVQRARRGGQLRLLTQRGRRNSFLSQGAVGDLSGY